MTGKWTLPATTVKRGKNKNRLKMRQGGQDQ